MTRQEIDEHLKSNAAYELATEHLRQRFATVMRDVQYGYGPTLQAFHFYSLGYHQGLKDADG